MKPIIKVENLGKQYRIGAREAVYGTLRESIVNLVRNPLRRWGKGNGQADESFWALKGVSLSIQPGEVLGLVGRNGAGKSTLLKILSRITEPTEGRVELYGRTASLLEVGTGFHPELTGRENVYLNGTILGMKRTEIVRNFDAIVAFSETEKFIDTPVKFYSSGMYLRLAFAVAAHLQPEILIVDEVLAVGDMAFQQKCLGKMRDVTNEGHTVVLVSHSMPIVSRLCQTSIWLDAGRIKAFGPTEEVIQSYLSTQQNLTAQYVRSVTEKAPHSQVFITAARLRRSGDEEEAAALLDARMGFSIEIEHRVLRETLAWVGFVISTNSGFEVLSATDGDIDSYAAASRSPGIYTSVCVIPGNLFNAGRYLLTVYAARTSGGRVEIFEFLENVLAFNIENSAGIGTYMPQQRKGVMSPKLEWKVKEGSESTATSRGLFPQVLA